ncbi:hypothetical protein NDA13_004278 [Ustilago tritici]|nr:hypothetical protein NDA13_004278 [Ustilago tritici]
MKKFSNQFFTLLLVLLSIRAFDLHALLGHATGSSASVWPAASAAPLYSASQAWNPQTGSRKPRVGIFIKDSSTLQKAPKKTIATGGSKSNGPAFENPNGRLGMKVKLKMLGRNQDADPLMLYQRHINKATSKLASILSRSGPTQEQMQQALERRKISILQRRGLLSEDSTLSPREGARHTKPRQGYTSHAESGGDMQRRFLSSIMDDLFGRTGLEGGSKAKSTIQQSTGLDIESNYIGYVAGIQIGSQNETFRMLIDSGSADTWVPSTACQACGGTHRKLGKSTSDTFVGLKTPFSIQYGTGDVSGNLARDDMEIASLNLASYTFAVTKQESSDFADETVPFDGLLGLARSALSNAGQPTPIDALYAEGKVQAPVMGYHLGRIADGYNDGKVTLGGVDPAKYSGKITEMDNVSTKGFWEASIDAITVGGTDLDLPGRTAILDTGTTLIVAPEADADAVHAQISGSKSDGQGGYTIPCTTTEQLAFTFGEVEFPVDTRDLLFLPVDQNDLLGDCVSAISAGNVGQRNEWLVGATFLKNVYFATNTEANKIGLARLNTTDTSSQGTMVPLRQSAASKLAKIASLD